MVFEYLLWELGNFKIQFHLPLLNFIVQVLSQTTSSISFLGKKRVAVFILVNCRKMINPVPKVDVG